MVSPHSSRFTYPSLGEDPLGPRGKIFCVKEKFSRVKVTNNYVIGTSYE